jgi:enterochelin esterase-like enzyme
MMLGLAIGVVLAAATAGPTAADFTGFDDFLGRLRAAPESGRPELIRRYLTWQGSHGGFPVVERDTAVFVYVATGQEKVVRVVGDFKPRNFNSPLWDTTGEPLTAAFGVYHRRMPLEPDARLLYQFAVDGKFVNDPLNPRTFVSGASPDAGKDGVPVSDLVMPGYRMRDLASPRAGVRPGRTLNVDEPWASPRVAIHLPAGYAPPRRYPVVYVADGGSWARIVGLPAILDNLIADGAIEPVIAVLIDPAEDRAGWYNFRSPYLPYLEKVIAWVDSHYSTRAAASGRLHLGSSAGGRISLAVVLERPDLFTNAALLSPSLVAPPHYYEPYFSGRRRPDPRLRIWLSAGTYEAYMHEDTHMLERYLRTTGVALTTTYTHEGHSFAAWRNLSGQVLEFFFRPPGK